MKAKFNSDGWLSGIEYGDFSIPFAGMQGFFMEKGGIETQIVCTMSGTALSGSTAGITVTAKFEEPQEHMRLWLRVENRADVTFAGKIGFHMGVDSYMESYPQWHSPFFPTMLRCEKTHLWGYYMNTAGNALAIATSGPVASYDIRYNRLEDGDYGHRILGTDILFFHDGILPDRHTLDLNQLKPGCVYENTVYLIPVRDKDDIVSRLNCIANIPIIQAEKYTFELGEKLTYCITGDVAEKRLKTPDNANTGEVMRCHGLYRLQVTATNGKQCEASFYCRPDWDFYLKNAAKQALAKPQKATTHVESFYGLFSCFLAAKHYGDKKLLEQALHSAEELLPLMFDFDTHTPIVIPERIQNTALLVSLLVDMYEACGDERYLSDAAGFANWLIDTKQGTDGVYRKEGRIHYTCVIYIAKAMLELALAEKKVSASGFSRHYASAKRAVDELVSSLDNIDTEGESTLEDGMISCSALQIGMFALTLPKPEQKPYIEAAERMMRIHTCLEQQLVPDCRCNGASLRYWESQYDVMVMANMLNSPHGWSAWTAYAHYYLYLLTRKKQYLVSLMNCMNSCAQLMTLDGNLRWGYCAQPYVKAQTLVPDYECPISEHGFRGKYEAREYGESYIDMISGWYRTGEQKLVGGYESCPLFLEKETLYVDNQGGCCDNDVHEIFKCMEETVLGKAFVHENADGSFLTYGCTAVRENGIVRILPRKHTEEIICTFQERDEK